MVNFPAVTIITPVYNGGQVFEECLDSVLQYKPSDWELIVVDDGSTDGSDRMAAEKGAHLLKTGGRMGPGAARNIGAREASGEYVCFIDADCAVNEFTFGNIAAELREYPEMEAFFGSYDDSPAAPNFVAQYKNLFHRYVHQIADEEASTFWAGCGIVRRATFLALGGFDLHRFNRPSIEDIELGYRIRQLGGKIRIAKSVQVKHYKAWNMYSLIKTDVFDRGVPWTRLLLANEICRVNELNIQISQKISVAAVYLLVASVVAALFQPAALILTAGLAALLTVVNWDVYRYFHQYRGFEFALKVVPMHWLYYLYAGASFIIGTMAHYYDVLTGRDKFVLEPSVTAAAARELARNR
ncbi:MAG TPA: glycosyltransferase family 2 protein [Planktothrix sp.]|jgi:glycosyltransferase involved in cell wall biosynthesis